MNSTQLFYLIIIILLLKYVYDLWLSFLNAKHFKDAIPKELEGIYNENEYKKSQDYKLVNYKFSLFTSTFSIIITLIFLFLDGFAIVNNWVQNFTENYITTSLLFFGVLFFALDIVNLPFAVYKTFVIEEKFGFNKTTLKTFITDKIKSWLITLILGGGILLLVLWFYHKTTVNFWWYTWILISGISILINMFYSKLIVPLFNKQVPLEDGELKSSIKEYAKKVGFKIDNIFVINGSKRSTKANAYFSGFGSQKRITLYDTLIKDLTTEEIIAVLAHEVGHYKKKHIIYNIIFSTLIMGFTLYLLSLFIGNINLAMALGVNQVTFHISLIAFMLLYSPISELTSLIMNFISRKFEYQADNFSKNTFNSNFLVSSLKKLSKNSLSNLTPHKWYVAVHYSHPTLLQRIENLKK
ncbi:MAG: M48 family metallopeptidase [Lutibacter sp.]